MLVIQIQIKAKDLNKCLAQDGYLLKGRWRPCLEITVLFCQFWQVIHQQKSQGLLKSVSSYEFLYLASFMADGMSHISSLSRIFQKKDIDCSVINDHIVGCIGTPKGLLDIPGPHFSNFKETLPLLCDDMLTEKPMEYEGHVVKFSEKCKTEAGLFKQ